MWFSTQCDGDWEHEFGVRIETLDNPGWTVVIDLSRTPLEHLPFDAVAHERGSNDWIHVTIEESQWRGVGGPANLSELLMLFLAFASPDNRAS
ncbi:MAG: immunity 53 family protein [Gaiellaceae bacterium]